MKDSIHKQFMELVGDRAGTFSVIAADALKTDGSNRGIFDLEAMTKAIEEAGLVLVYEDGKTGAWARVFRPYTAEERAACSSEAIDEDCRHLVAQGFAPNRPSAFMHAVFGAAREEHAKAAVAKTLSDSGVEVDAKLHAELERRFILEGGQKRLDADVAQMVSMKKVN